MIARKVIPLCVSIKNFCFTDFVLWLFHFRESTLLINFWQFYSNITIIVAEYQSSDGVLAIRDSNQ